MSDVDPAVRTAGPSEYDSTAEWARAQDASDPLRDFRERFLFPIAPRTGTRALYFCGNSLGLQPAAARTIVEQELEDWAHFGVEGHHEAKTPWYSYHEVFRDPLARVVGALPTEVVAMNSLTTNLHLLMVSFYQPSGRRRKVIMESPAFPSDIYAVRTHLRSRGIDPDDAIVEVRPPEGEYTVRDADVIEAIDAAGDELAMVMIGGVNYFTGQVFDMAGITAAAHRVGAVAGFDLAHGAGNIVLSLHDWNVDFAAWCSYKYLNAGPGAIAGAFVHERHGLNTDLPRFGGWWGNDPETRFRMHLEPEFIPRPDADAWQLSNPPILAMAPLRASLDCFDEAGMPVLQAKSRRLTGYLRWLIEQQPRDWFEIITPREERSSGSQLSMLVHDRPEDRFEALQDAGVICDFRQPNVIRVAPAALYNSFEDVHRFAAVLTSLSTEG